MLSEYRFRDWKKKERKRQLIESNCLHLSVSVSVPIDQSKRRRGTGSWGVMNGRGGGGGGNLLTTFHPCCFGVNVESPVY